MTPKAQPPKARSKPRAAASRARQERPTGGRAHETYEKLVKAAGELLGEVGFERLTSNAICARADVTPPAFYHYFEDKYKILEELARRLLKKQNDAYAIWLFQNGGKSAPEEQVTALEDWLRQAAAVVAHEPGAFWTLRALRALPNLAHMRLESQRLFTDQMVAFARRIIPDVPVETLWCRFRIIAEFGFVVDELALEEDKIPRDALFREAARLIQGALEEVGRKEPSRR